MNKDDKKIFQKLNKDIEIPQSYFDTINYTLSQLPDKQQNKKKFLNKYKFTLAITCCSLILVTGVVFAKDIENYFKKIFAYSTPAIDNAIENGFVQSVDSDFTYDNNIGIKVDNLILDDLNLDISICYETQIENIQSIQFEQYKISNDNKEIIYEYDNINQSTVSLASSMQRTEHSEKVTDTTYKDSILFELKENSKDFNKIIFEINSLRITYTDNTFEILNGHWKFNIVLSDEMKKSDNIHYSMLGNNEYVESCTGILSATGMTVELVLKSSLDLNQWDLAMDSPEFLNLKNNNQTFSFKEFYVKDNNSCIIQYNNIGKFFDDINMLELNLKVFDTTIILNREFD